jgi:hypothetical protein
MERVTAASTEPYIHTVPCEPSIEKNKSKLDSPLLGDDLLGPKLSWLLGTSSITGRNDPVDYWVYTMYATVRAQF